MKEHSGAESRTEKKRAQIREAAKQLFLQAGFQGSSTDAIMVAANIASKETLYRYYASKEELFVDVLRSLTTERLHLQQLLEQSASPKSQQELRALLRAITQEILKSMLQADYLALIRLIMAELPRFPQLGTLFRQSVPEPAMHYLLTLLRNGQINGVVRPDKNLEVIGRMVIGTCMTYAILDGLLLNTQAPPMPEPGIIDTLVENIMDAVSKQE